MIEIEGTITREIEGREVKIPFSIGEYGFAQWGHDTMTLGENVELLEALVEAVSNQ